MPATLQTQPHSLEAERTVLGALLIDEDAILKVRGKLQPDDFYDPVYRTIYEAIARLFDERKKIDFVTVAAILQNDKHLSSIGGSAFLAELAAAVPTASHIEQYATIVAEKGSQRALITAGQKIMGLGYEESSPLVDLLAQAQAEMLSLSGQGSGHPSATLGAVAKDRYRVIGEIRDGGDSELKRRVLTGYRDIDYYFNGFEPGTLNIVAGRPSMGKSALLLDIARNASQAGTKKVLVLSLEMTREQLTDRLLAGASGVSMPAMYRGQVDDEQFLFLGKAVDDLQQYTITLDDDPDSSLPNLQTKALRHHYEQGLDLLVIDYLQLIEAPPETRKRGNRVEQVSAISRGLKKLARDLGAPILAGCQLSRQVESRPQCIPLLADLRESGSIEQDADNVLMLYREGYYDEDCAEPDVTTVYIRKNRQGPVGMAELMFNKETTQFVALDRQHAASGAA